MRKTKPIMTYLSEKDAYEIVEGAKKKKISVSEFVRQILIKKDTGSYYNDKHGILRERK